MLFYWQNELIQEWQRNCNLGHANYSKPQVSPENIGEQPYFIWKRCLWNWDQSKDLATGRPFWTIQLARDAKCVPEGGTQGRFAATEGKGR